MSDVTTEQLPEPDDLAGVAATDALLDALATGSVEIPAQATPADDELARLLRAWRGELDDRASSFDQPAPTSVVPLADARGARRWARAHTRTAGVLAATVALAAVSGVAAAVPGSPLHRAFFDTQPAHHTDSVAARVAVMLDAVEQRIQSARSAGGVTPSQRAALNSQLDRARDLLTTDPLAPDSLADRVAGLRTALLALAPLTPPRDGDHGSGAPGEDATAGHDTGTGTGGHGSDDAAGHEQGEDHGDASGDGGSDGDDGDGGSDDGQTGVHSGDSGGSDDGRTAGSDDGGARDGGSGDETSDDGGSGDSTGGDDGGSSSSDGGSDDSGSADSAAGGGSDDGGGGGDASAYVSGDSTDGGDFSHTVDGD